LNGVILIETKMEYSQLRTWLRDQEHALGRIRGEDRYGPRTIDMDIVVWNGEIVDEDVYTRSYLLRSVKEVLPEGIFEKAISKGTVSTVNSKDNAHRVSK
jgi:2-amino-4-hydroxy-6-hydroxymethyldihydropteridine diphosphokinase